MKYLTTVVLGILGVNAPSFATQYYAVPALTGNANMGVNCIHAPQTIDSSGVATKCKQLTVPNNPRIAAQFPVPPKHYTVEFNNPDSPVFSEFNGYPMIIEHSSGKCFLRNQLVNTVEPKRNVLPSEFTSFEYDCPTGPEESFDTSRLLYQYTVSGAFQPQNDAHLFASVTMQMAAHYFAELYPQQAELCPEWGGQYCLKQLQQRVGYSVEGQKYSSDWDGEFVNLAEGGSVVGQFSHASSLDIVAHEIGHALLSWNSELLYQGEEPSAVQEAFSDMTALAARDYYIRHIDGGAANSFLQSPMVLAWQNSAEKMWWMGTGFNFSGNPLRYIAQPRFDLISIDDTRDLAEANGPHQKAGALNKFFYLLATSEQWSVERAYKLALKAANNCFRRDSGINEAGLCFQSQADYEDKALIGELLRQVGIVSWQSQSEHLAFDIERQLDELRFSVTDNRFSNNQVKRFNVSIDGVPYLAWQKNSGQGSFNKVKTGRLSMPLGAALVELEIQLSNGQTLSAARHVYSADQARCQPMMIGDAMTTLRVNEEQLNVTKVFEQLALNTALYSQDLLTLDFNTHLNNKVVSVFADLDRDRVFEDDNNSNELIFTQTDSSEGASFKLLGAEQVNEGPMLLRVRIDDTQKGACEVADGSQVIDLKINLKSGSNLQSVDFSSQQVNDQITLTAQATGQGSHTFNWYFNGNLEAENTDTLIRAFTAETLVQVDSLRDGQVVATQQKKVQPVASLDLKIQCAVEGTQCLFSTQHLPLPNSVSARYFWQFGDQVDTKDTRTDTSNFIFDYQSSGQYNANLTVYLDSLNAQFTTSTVVNIENAKPEIVFNTTADPLDPMRILFSVENIDLYKKVFWSVEQKRYEQSDLTRDWEYIFNEAGTYPVLLTVIYPDDTPKTIRKEIIVEPAAPVTQPNLQILSIHTDVMSSWAFWSCETKYARDVLPDSEIKSACNNAQINSVLVNTNLEDTSLLRSDYWVDRNKDGIFSQDEKNTNLSFKFDGSRVPVCVTAYTLEQAGSSSACIAPEGGATFNFYINK